MTFIHKPIRIEPAFDDAKQVRDMFERHAPYRAVAAYGLDVRVDETTHSRQNGQFFPGSGETGPWPGSPLWTAPR